MYKSKRKDLIGLAVYIFTSVFGQKKTDPEERIIKDILDQKVDIADFIIFIDHLSGRPKLLRHAFRYEVGLVDLFMEKRNTIMSVFSNVARKTMARQRAEVFYSQQDLEQMLRVPANIIQSLIADESIKAIKVRKEIRIRKADLEEYLSRSAYKKKTEEPKKLEPKKVDTEPKKTEKKPEPPKNVPKKEEPKPKKKQNPPQQAGGSHISTGASFMTLNAMTGLVQKPKTEPLAKKEEKQSVEPKEPSQTEVATSHEPTEPQKIETPPPSVPKEKEEPAKTEEPANPKEPSTAEKETVKEPINNEEPASHKEGELPQQETIKEELPAQEESVEKPKASEKSAEERIEEAVKNVEEVIRPNTVNISDNKVELSSAPVSNKVMDLF